MSPTDPQIAFIGGGNMAGAIIGGLLRGSGRAPESVLVIDPGEAARDKLGTDFGVRTRPAAGPELAVATTVVWAVKPQYFAAAAAPCAPYISGALQLSVMAGIRIQSIAAASGAQRIVRAMPNTPALIGRGVAGLHAGATVGADERAEVETILRPTGELVWVEREADLEAVTALSGSGPAYVFYVLEAMIEAAVALGLSAGQGRALALATFAGATQLAAESPEAPEVLRARVTSKGGTTFAALTALEDRGVKAAFVTAIRAAAQRAVELGDEFGRAPPDV